MVRSTRTFPIAFLTLVMLVATSVGQEQEKAGKANPKDSATNSKVASITIRGSYSESVAPPGLFGDMEPNLATLLSRLDDAAKDKQIAVVLLRMRNPGIGRAKMEEVRRAIARLRKADKKVIAELQSGETSDYMLASACDEIVMPESGVLMLPGIRAEMTFFKGLLDLLGIQAEMMQVGDFKGAAEPFTRKEMSPEFRKQYDSLLDDFYDQLIQTIASDRKLDVAKVKELIDVALFTATEAKQAGLIDEVAYDDELRESLKSRLGRDKLEIVENYAHKKIDSDFSGMMGMMKMFELILGGQQPSRGSSNKKIAVIHTVGVITTGAGLPSLFGEQGVGSDTVVKALRDVANDKTVVAVVLRVDSPGGSALGSDLIWREISRIEKPVVASMGDVAASGGYYISMGCDQIFAEPGTITGSIGVVGGKIALKGLYDKVGVTTEVLSRGKNTGLLSSDMPMTADERAANLKLMREIYRQFVSKAATGRKMEPEKLESFASGRIWTGRQAKDRGLVDQLGGLKEAIADAKQRAGIPADEKLELLILPKPKSLLDHLLDGEPLMLGNVSNLGAALPTGIQSSLGDVADLYRLFSERALCLMPCRIRIH